MNGQLSLFDTLSGKMSAGHSAATSEMVSGTSEPCWKRYAAWQNQPFLFLDLRKNKNGQKPDASCWTEQVLHGEYTTPNTSSPSEEEEYASWQTTTDIQRLISYLNVSEAPNHPIESKLSDLIVPNAPKKYHLSKKALEGLVRRSEKRGKSLQERLKKAIEQVLTRYRSEEDAPGGGKGPLVQTEQSATLSTSQTQTLFYAVQSAGFDGNVGAKYSSIGYEDEAVPTLIARRAHHIVYAIGNGQANQLGMHELVGTINCMHDQQAILYDMTHANDVIRDCGEVSPTLQSRMGTGGNQVPIVVQEELKYFVNSSGDDIAGTLDAHYYKGPGERGGTEREVVATYDYQWIIRRLMPIECERLQAFPDNWTDIGDWVDTKGKKHKASDTPRYKALGNSICRPWWSWMFRRMANYLPEHATLGSLFDGIGGFPLCWEMIHGKGTARWASEIEEFPIAVTKLRFPEEE